MVCFAFTRAYLLQLPPREEDPASRSEVQQHLSAGENREDWGLWSGHHENLEGWIAPTYGLGVLDGERAQLALYI